jgi:16S rRNA (uracil1498-N3)-methyltransferase
MPTLSATAAPLKEELKRLDGVTSAVVLIGPEGDFTREEALLAQRAGVRLVSLGRLTLRSETAAIATLSILQYVVGGL